MWGRGCLYVGGGCGVCVEGGVYRGFVHVIHGQPVPSGLATLWKPFPIPNPGFSPAYPLKNGWP